MNGTASRRAGRLLTLGVPLTCLAAYLLYRRLTGNKSSDAGMTGPPSGTEQSLRGNGHVGGDRESRDAAFWAQRVERIDVAEVPAGAVSLNVHGRREIGALQGFGPLWRKTYRIPLNGVDATPAEVMRVWKERFPEFHPRQSRFFPSLAGVRPGEVLLINASVGGVVPVYTGVRVIYADDESFTVMTAEGLPEAGWNTFSAYEEDGRTWIQVQSLARTADPIYEVGFRVAGSTEQERIWAHVLTSLASHFGVDEPVRLEKICIDPKLQWPHAAKNLWYNAGIRSMLYLMMTPVRWVQNRLLGS